MMMMMMMGERNVWPPSLAINRGFTSASMSHADAATEMQGDHHTDSVIAGFHPAG